MKKFRLSAFLILAFCLALSISPSAVAAEEGSCGPNATWRFEDGTLTISGSGLVTDLCWYDFHNQIQKVVVEPGIINLPENAFQDCEFLTDVTLPEGFAHIGAFAFHNCKSLGTIQFPDTLSRIGQHAFSNSGITGITIPGRVGRIDNGTFDGCEKLLHVTLEEGVTFIGTSAFSDCKKLTEIILPDSLDTMGENAFQNCTSLNSIVLSPNLKVIPSRAFQGCKSLKSVTLSPKTSRIEYEAFQNCHDLRSITIPPSVQFIYGLPSTLEEVHISDLTAWCEATHDSVFHCLRNAKLFLNGELITDLVIPAGCEQIGEHAFHDYAYLKSVTIPEGVTGIAWCAFNGCQNLQQITLPHSLEAIGPNVFQNCSSLTQVTYLGTAEDLPNLLIGEHNDSLLAASWNFGPLGTALIVIDALRIGLLIACLIGSSVLIACLVIYIRQKKYPFL